ncbi:MAG: TetR family transcriptional regulator [Mycobacterium sp.]
MTGLRERKKRQTRTTLIDVAVELCQRQGYDHTTVEQIAAAAEVSTRTFSRYFPTKESVIAAAADEVDETIAAALAGQPAELTAYEALLRAHLQAFSPDATGPSPAFIRMAVMIQIVNASPTLNESAFAIKQDLAENAALRVLGARLDLPPTDPTVRLIADTWTVLFATSFRGMGTPGDDPIDAEVLCARLTATFETFARVTAPPQPDGQPPAGASQR